MASWRPSWLAIDVFHTESGVVDLLRSCWGTLNRDLASWRGHSITCLQSQGIDQRLIVLSADSPDISAAAVSDHLLWTLIHETERDALIVTKKEADVCKNANYLQRKQRIRQGGPPIVLRGLLGGRGGNWRYRRAVKTLEALLKRGDVAIAATTLRTRAFRHATWIVGINDWK